MNKNQFDYIADYNKKNYKMYQFRVKKSNKDLIEKMDSISNRNGYINDLIMEDIKPSVLTIKQIREKIKPIIKKHHVNEVYLFGSYSRGEANRNSDVDLYCDRGDVDTLWKASAFKEELENALGKSVDIINIGSEMDGFFKEQLEEDMIRIY